MIGFGIDWQLLSQHWLITLVHFLWQAIVVGLLLSLMLRLFAKSSARLRYTLSCAALLTLPILALGTFAWISSTSHQSVWLQIDSLEPPAIAQALVLTRNTTDRRPFNRVTNSAGNTIGLGLHKSTPAGQTQSTAKIKPEPAVSTQSQTFLAQWSPWLMAAYGVGVLFVLARLSIAIWSSQCLRTAIQPITDPTLLDAISTQAKRIGLRFVPVAGLCERVSAPMVVGFLKPIILLPPALLSGLEPQQLSLILAHELAHIRRYDLLVNLCQRFIEALLFFHPVTWWISHRIRIERENCCDDLAASDTGQLTYAAALLAAAELCVGRGSKQAATLAAMSVTGGNANEIASRIRRLINADDVPKIGISKSGLRLLTIAMVVSLLSVVAWGNSERASEMPSPTDDVPHQGTMVTHVYKYQSGMGATEPLAEEGQLKTGYYSYDPQRAKSNWNSSVKWNLLESKDGIDTYRLKIKYEPKTGSATTTTHDLAFDGVKTAKVEVNQWLTVSIEPPRTEQLESWEVSKVYDKEFLRFYLQDHETLPNPIEVPAIRGQVVNPDGQPVSQVAVVSHTPRQPVQIEGEKIVMAASPGPTKRTDAQGKFGLPKRTEAYRVLFVHQSGVASVDHETLIRNQGKVTLQPWATVTGTLIVDGKPVANEPIRMRVNAFKWSYRRFEPNLSSHRVVTTDASGFFRFENVPPLPVQVCQSPSGQPLQRNVAVSCESGETSSVKLGEGQTITGNLILAKEFDKSKLTIEVAPMLPPIPYPEELTDSPWKEKQAWARRWNATDAGVKLEDERFLKQNTRYVGKREAGGQFIIYGVPAGEMQLLIRSPDVKKPIVKKFTVKEISNQPLDFGRLQFSADPPIPDKNLPKLTVTMTMLKHIDLEFEITDKATGEGISWVEISYQDQAGKWRVMALINGPDQHNFVPLSAKILSSPLRVVANGYKPVYFSLPKRDSKTPPKKHRIELEPGQGEASLNKPTKAVEPDGKSPEVIEAETNNKKLTMHPSLAKELLELKRETCKQTLANIAKLDNYLFPYYSDHNNPSSSNDADIERVYANRRVWKVYECLSEGKISQAELSQDLKARIQRLRNALAAPVKEIQWNEDTSLEALLAGPDLDRERIGLCSDLFLMMTNKKNTTYKNALVETINWQKEAASSDRKESGRVFQISTRFLLETWMIHEVGLKNWTAETPVPELLEGVVKLKRLKPITKWDARFSSFDPPTALDGEFKLNPTEVLFDLPLFEWSEDVTNAQLTGLLDGLTN